MRLVLLAALALTPLTAMAQTRISGTVQAIKHGVVTVQSDDGPVYDIALAPQAQLQTMQPMKLSDIHVGDFVGSGATRLASGRFIANEVHIIPKGTGEGQRGMGKDPSQIMTNATITALNPTPPGETMVLTYGAHQQPIFLPPSVKVTAFVAPPPGALKAGAKVMMIASTGATADLTANMVIISSPGARAP